MTKVSWGAEGIVFIGHPGEYTVFLDDICYNVEIYEKNHTRYLTGRFKERGGEPRFISDNAFKTGTQNMEDALIVVARKIKEWHAAKHGQQQ